MRFFAFLGVRLFTEIEKGGGCWFEGPSPQTESGIDLIKWFNWSSSLSLSVILSTLELQVQTFISRGPDWIMNVGEINTMSTIDRYFKVFVEKKKLFWKVLKRVCTGFLTNKTTISLSKTVRNISHEHRPRRKQLALFPKATGGEKELLPEWIHPQAENMSTSARVGRVEQNLAAWSLLGPSDVWPQRSFCHQDAQHLSGLLRSRRAIFQETTTNGGGKALGVKMVATRRSARGHLGRTSRVKTRRGGLLFGVDS